MPQVKRTLLGNRFGGFADVLDASFEVSRSEARALRDAGKVEIAILRFVSGKGEVDRFGGPVWDEWIVEIDNVTMVEGFMSKEDAQAFVVERANRRKES